MTGNAGQPPALLVLQLYGLAALVPLVALIAGTGVFGAEMASSPERGRTAWPRA